MPSRFKTAIIFPNPVFAERISKIRFNLWVSAEKSNENAKWMLNAFEEGKLTLDEKEIVRYKNRIYETLNDEAKADVIKIAKIDIANILNAMKPAKKEMLLYR